jgi:tRNA modification GTPase
MYSRDDTIVALATPPGRGGLGVVRISGPRALAIARALIQGGRRLQPRYATLVHVTVGGPDGPGRARIDEAVATFFPAGGSYTGEDVVEFSLHGSPVVLGEVIAAAVALGARRARAGEFTLRAFLGGRLDLTRAEAVHDLVEATTPAQARTAFDQLQGTLAERIGEIEREIFDLIARLEASGDFPEEGYHFITPEETRTAVESVAGRIDRLLAGARRGRLIREGVCVAIVGRPNVGKSTLFNRLAGAERAIVTAVPGTTRDVLMEDVMLLGTRMMLADTAGVRHTTDPIEREGVARAERAGAVADVVVVVLDATGPLTDEDRRVLDASGGRPRVVAWNKCDLVVEGGAVSRGDGAGSGSAAWERGAWVKQDASAKEQAPDEGGGVRISARTGQGIDDLVRAMADAVGIGQGPESATISNARHIELLGRAGAAIARAGSLIAKIGQTPEEVLLSDLREAREALEEVSGKRTTSDLLEAIFSKFCVGK